MVCEQTVEIAAKPSNAGGYRKPTTQQWLLVKELVLKGVSAADISRRLGIPRTTIVSKVQQEGWEPVDPLSPTDQAALEELEKERVAWGKLSVETWKDLAAGVRRGIKLFVACDEVDEERSGKWVAAWKALDAGARAALGLDSGGGSRMTVNSGKTNILVR